MRVVWRELVKGANSVKAKVWCGFSIHQVMNPSGFLNLVTVVMVSKMVKVTSVKRDPEGRVYFRWAEVMPFVRCTADEDEFIQRTGRGFDDVSVIGISLYCHECFSLYNSVLSAMPNEGSEGETGGDLWCWCGHRIDGQLESRGRFEEDGVV